MIEPLKKNQRIRNNYRQCI